LATSAPIIRYSRSTRFSEALAVERRRRRSRWTLLFARPVADSEAACRSLADLMEAKQATVPELAQIEA